MILSSEQMESYIYEKMQLLRSPYQISKRMTKDSRLTGESRDYISIHLFSKQRRAEEGVDCLFAARRQSRNLETEKRGKITDMISISQRPVKVEDCIIPVHWEGDFIVGKDHKSAIGTLLERSTVYWYTLREEIRKA